MDLPARFNAASYFVDRHVAEGRGHLGLSPCGPLDHVRSARRRPRGAAQGLGGLGSNQHRVLLALNDSPVFPAAFWAR